MIKLPEKTLSLKLEKGMYGEAQRLSKTEKKHISFSSFLERQDPTEPKYPLDAFERQLARFGIVTKGEQISLVEDFYKTYESAVLFPEFINRNVLIGYKFGKNELKIDDLVALTEYIDGVVFNPTYAEDSTEEEEIYQVGEMGEFPTTTIGIAEKPVKAIKVGRRLKASYEVIRRMQINLLALHLQLIGQKMQRAMTKWALDVFVNGDGNTNPAPTQNIETPGALKYDDLVDFELDFAALGFEKTHMVGTTAIVKDILKMTEFKDVVAGFNFQATGNMVSPFGDILRYHPSTPANKILGWDQKSHLEIIKERGAQLTETERIIEKQFEQVIISDVLAISKMFTNAGRILITVF
jgi:hypothetical protein